MTTGVSLWTNDDLERIACQLGGGSRHDELKFVGADLSNYWMHVGGLCTRADELANESTGWLLKVQEELGTSFFEWCPKYRPLAPLVTQANTPVLYAECALFERLRGQLLALISLLLASRTVRG
jgi:YxiJ-like protein